MLVLEICWHCHDERALVDNRVSFQNPRIAIKTYPKEHLSYKSPFSPSFFLSCCIAAKLWSFFCLGVMFRGMLRPVCVCLEIPEELRHRSRLCHTQSQSHTSRQCQHHCICSLQLRHANTASEIFDGSVLALVLKE